MRDRVDLNTGEVLEPEVEAMPMGSAIARAHETAAMDVQVATAQRIGRDIAVFQADLMKWATLNAETARQMTYAKPVGGDKVIGPSARFAELVMAAYKHVAVDVTIEEEGHGFVTVASAARDFYRNVSVRKRVRRSVLKSDGRTRQAEHLVANHVNAASSIALRNSIFTLVPRALWMPAWLKSREVAAGDAKDFGTRLMEVLGFWAKKGVGEEPILAFLQRKDVKELDTDDLLILQQRYDDVRAGELKLEDAFKVAEPERAGDDRAQEATSRLDGAKAPTEPESPVQLPKRPQPRRSEKPAKPAESKGEPTSGDAPPINI